MLLNKLKDIGHSLEFSVADKGLRQLSILGFILISLIYLFWSWHGQLSDFTGDEATYLVIARYFSPFTDASRVDEYFFSHSPFPPLYPLILGIFNAADNIWLAHAITTSCLLLFLPVFYYWQRYNDISPWQAGLLTALFALLPGTYGMALAILSENTYLLFSMAFLFSVARCEKNQSQAWYWLASAFIMLAWLTRSVGVVLYAAYVVHLFVYRPKRWLLFLLVSAAPVVLWNSFHSNEGNSYISALLKSYQPGLLQYASEVTRFTSSALLDGWVNTFTDNGFGRPVGMLLGVICLVGMVHRVYLLKIDGVYVALYLVVIILWPAPPHAQRFLYVVVPILVVQGWLFLRYIANRVLKMQRDVAVFMLYSLSVLVITLPLLVRLITRAADPVPKEYADYAVTMHWYGIESRTQARSLVVFRKAFIDSLRKATRLIPADACVYSIHPAVLAFYTRRMSYPYPAVTTTDEDFNQSLRAHDCEYSYLTHLVVPGYPVSFYPAMRMEDALIAIDITRLTNEPNSPVIAILAILRKLKGPE